MTKSGLALVTGSALVLLVAIIGSVISDDRQSSALFEPAGNGLIGDGELSLFDSSGTGKERLLTPPLPLSVGGHYFNTNIQVAPMFRPPYGDGILSADENGLSVFDADLSGATRLGRDVLERYEPYALTWPTWSPGGSHIAFYLALAPTTVPRYGEGLFVMSAEGDKLRRVTGDGSFSQWSPDGSLLAYEQGR